MYLMSTNEGGGAFRLIRWEYYFRYIVFFSLFNAFAAATTTVSFIKLKVFISPIFCH
uniref:Uncharacterized protein n=1 Tax=Heterorhabditis bacteriophora TaxID=37862 RepID=A0A1I7X2B1_HETBA